MPGLADLKALPTEQQELLLDVGLFALDIIRIVEPTPSVEVLESKAAGAADHWTAGGAKPHQATKVINGKPERVGAEHVAGGGTRFFLPRAWEFLEEVAVPMMK